jgi:sodium-dependent phosphate transporter
VPNETFVCFLVYKGAPSLGLADITEETQAAAIVGTSAVITALAMGFWLPFVYCKVVRKDYTIRWFHFFYGPALWWRTAPEDAGQDGTKIAVQDYRIRDRDTAEDGSAPC